MKKLFEKATKRTAANPVIEDDWPTDDSQPSEAEQSDECNCGADQEIALQRRLEHEGKIKALGIVTVVHGPRCPKRQS